ncbi:hypothetical protein ACPV5A_07200 [Vibrio chagasii]|uniref:hypothetical protein n=1 Tax=Vibrio chagasii TaxID=170679 RepID=UPI004068FF79
MKMWVVIFFSLIFSRTLPLLKYQSSSKINVKNKHKIISYHSITNDNEKRLNWKISPFKGYFTFDELGYSGFGTSAKRRCELLGFNDDETKSRAERFLFRKKVSKYHIINRNTLEGVRKIIVVEQLDDDSVSALRVIDNAQLIEIAHMLSGVYGAVVCFRPHPLSKHKAPENIIIDKSDFEELKSSDSIILTHNSGYGIQSVSNDIKTVFFCRNEFKDTHFDSSININDMASYAKKEIDDFKMANYSEYFSSIVSVYDFRLIFRMISNFVR